MEGARQGKRADDTPREAPAAKPAVELSVHPLDTAVRTRSARGIRKRTVGVIVVCVVVLALLAVLPAFANTAVGYVPILAALFLLVLGFAYLLVLKRSLDFAEHGPSSGSVRGDVLQFALSVKNRSILPATRIDALFYVANVQGEGERVELRHLSLPPRSEKVFDLGVRFDHIGLFRVGIRQVGLYDPFGVFYSLRDNSTLHTVNILPRVLDITAFDLSEHSQRESTKNIKTFINDGMDYSSVRDYRWGDPMKSIHWKLSSKSKDGYFTRLYETPSTPGVAIFLDFESRLQDAEAILDAYDAVVESALSIEGFAVKAGFDTRLLFIDARGEDQNVVGPVSDRLEDLVRLFPRMREGSGRPTIELLRRVAASPNCPNNLVVCTTNANEEMVNALASLGGPMRSPYLVAVYADDDERAGLARQVRRLQDLRIPAALVRRADDLLSGGA